MGILIAYVLGILTALKPKDHNRVGEHRGTDSHESQRFPRATSVEKQAEKKKKKGRQTISFWVRIASLAVLVIYAGVTILIWCANKQSAETAERALEAESRPWIGLIGVPEIVDESVSRKIDGNDPTVKKVNNLQLSIKLQNFGKSPAVRLAFRFKPLWVIAPKVQDRETSGLCDPPAKDQLFTTFVDSVFPGADAVLQKKNFSAASDPVPVTDVREPNYLFGCITYQRSGSPKLYWTYVVYSLERERVPSSYDPNFHRVISIATVETEAQ